MYSSHHRYLAVAFADAESVSPNIQDITYLMTEFAPIEVIPNSVTEQAPAGSKNRVVFVSQNNSWQIALLSKQFQVTKVATDPLKDHLGDFSDFCSQAARILKITLERFQRKAHRLAALREGYLKEMPDAKMSRMAARLMNMPNIYKDNPVTEWDWRAVTQIEREIEGVKEPTNTITIIKRVNGELVSPQGQLGLPTRFSRIRVDLDINTAPINTSARFTGQHIDKFYAQVQEWHRDLELEITTFIGEE